MKAFPNPNNTLQSGMDLRDWFAGKALMSMLSAVQNITDSTPSIAARYSYKIADAMIEERKKKDEDNK